MNGQKVLRMKNPSKRVPRLSAATQDEHTFYVPSTLGTKEDDDEEESKGDDVLELELSFYGNYSEPVLCVPLNPYLAELVDADDGEMVLSLSMNISTKEWTVNKLDFVPKPDITAKQRKNPSKSNK